MYMKKICCDCNKSFKFLVKCTGLLVMYQLNCRKQNTLGNFIFVPRILHFLSPSILFYKTIFAGKNKKFVTDFISNTPPPCVYLILLFFLFVSYHCCHYFLKSSLVSWFLVLWKRFHLFISPSQKKNQWKLVFSL